MNSSPKPIFKRCSKILILLLLLVVFPEGEIMAQGCECTSCQGPIPVEATLSYEFQISGATNNNLADPNQGICGVFIDLNFEHIWSLTITLTSPSGQTITLIGPYDDFPGTTLLSNWDISFLPCSNNVTPDIMANGTPFNEQWTNLQGWALFTNYTGSYYPYIGCLEDFNSGPVNGTWSLTIANGSNIYGNGALNNFSILLCDDNGTGCDGCDANAGDLSVVDDIYLCEGENFSGDIDPFYTFGSEPNNQYSYTYIISQNSIIQNYIENPDINSFANGQYEICGLSYLTADAGLIPSPNGSMSVSDLDNMLNTAPPFCGDISDDCFIVGITPIPADIIINDIFCQGNTYDYNGISYSTSGTFFINLPATNSCDTTVELTLTEIQSITENIDATICQGDTFFVGNSFYISDGNYSDAFILPNGCDSTVNLTLTVLNPQSNITPPTALTCTNPEIQLSGTTSSSGTGIFYNWVTSDGNITGNPNSVTTTVDEAGKYYLFVSILQNGVNCSVIDSVIVNSEIAFPNVNAGVDSSLDCSVTSIVLNGTSTTSGGLSYEWTTIDGNIVQDTFTPNPMIDAAGSYVLTITNTNNSCTSQDSVFIDLNNTPPTAVGGMNMQLNCNNSILQLDGTASSQSDSVTYLWTTTDGSILLGETTLTPTIDSTGMYLLTVTDTFNHCTATDMVQVTIDTLPPLVDVGNDFTLNCFDDEMEINAINSAQGMFFPFTWTVVSGAPILSDANTLTPTVNGAGVYELEITNSITGCTASSQVVVNEDFMAPTANVQLPVDTITCFATNVIIDATNSSSGSDFDYEWTIIGSGNIVGANDNNSLEVNMAGTYQLEITNNQNGCTTITTVDVFSNNALPSVNAGTDLEINCNNLEVDLNGNGSMGVEFVYLWTPLNGGNIVDGASTLFPTVNAAGDYELLVTNNITGCTQTDIVSVTVDTLPPTADAGIDTLINCYNNTITLDGSNSSTGDFSYLWSTSNGVTPTNSTTLQPTITATGDYEILVTNNQSGCTASDSIFVGENFDTPIADAGQDTSLNCTAPIIFLNGNNSTGSNLNYEWTATNGGSIISGTMTSQIEINAVGTYELVITNAVSGCTDMDEVIVSDDSNSPIAVAGLPDTITCNQNVITLDGSTSSLGTQIEYLWETSDGSILLGNTTTTPQVEEEGLYFLTVTNLENGCSAIDSVLISIDTIAPIADAGSPQLLNCITTSIILNGTNSSTGNEFSYEWTTNIGNVSANGNTSQPTVNQVGTYYLEVTNNNNGCTSIDSVLVSENINQPIAVLGNDTLITCLNPILTLDGTASSMGVDEVLEWNTLNGGAILNNGNTFQPDVNTAGTYVLIITDTISGCSATDTLIVDLDTAFPIADAGIDDEINCNNSILTLNGTASSSGISIEYLWETVDGNILLGNATPTPKVDKEGWYILTVTNTDNGCLVMDSVLISIDTIAPIAEAGVSQLLNCLATSVMLDGTNSSTGNEFSYEWMTNTGNISANGNTSQPTVNQIGMYYLEVTNNNNGCTSIDSVLVSENINQPIAVLGNDTLITCLNPILTLDGTASSMGVDEVLEWNTLNGGAILNNGNTFQPNVNTAGTYVLIVTDTISGCSATDTLIVDIDTAIPIADAGVDNEINCNQSVLTLDGINSSTGADFIAQWITVDGHFVSVANTLTPQVDSAGTYILEVTNIQNNCVTEDSVLITIDTIPPIANAGVDTAFTCVSTLLQLDGTASSQGGNFDYQWTSTSLGTITNPTTLTPTIDSAGIYQLEILNILNGCTAIDEVEIIWDTIAPIADAGQDATLDCDVTSLILGGNSSIGNNFEYEWTFIAGGNITSSIINPTATVISGATYTLTVTNLNNSCTSFDEVVVTQDADIPIAFAAITNDTLGCDDTQMTLDGTGSSMGTDFIYEWTTTNGNILSDTFSLQPIIDDAGTYTLAVTNTVNNCIDSIDVNILLENCDPTANAGNDTIINCSHPMINLDGGGSSSGSQFEYEWTTMNGNIVADTFTLFPLIDAAGTYILTVQNIIYGTVLIDTVEVTESFEEPIVFLSVNELLGCVDTTVFVSGVGSSLGAIYTYSWSTNDGNIVSGNGTDSILVNESGFYILEVINTINGCSVIDSIEVEQDVDVPIAQTGNDLEINCYNPQVNLDGSGSSTGINFVYNWTTLDGNIISGNGGLSPLVDSSGTYVLEVVDLFNGCSVQSTVVVTENFDTPIVTLGGTDTLNCANPILTLNGSPSGNDLIYAWTTIGGNVLLGNDSINTQIDEAGIYQLSVFNNLSGCSDSSSVIIAENFSTPIADAGMDMQLDCGLSSISLDGTNSSQGNDFTYTWTTPNGDILSGNNSLTPEITIAGTYILTIENTLSECVAVDSVQITSLNCAPNAVVILPDTLTCTVNEITLDGSNSSNWASIIYEWTTPNGNISGTTNASTTTVTIAGTYQLKAIDTLNNLVDSVSVIVEIDTIPPIADAGIPDILNCGITQLQLDASASSGSALTYLWTTQNGNFVNGQNTMMPVINEDGTYDVEVTDMGNGCTAIASVNIEIDTIAPLADAGNIMTITCVDTLLNLDGTASSQGSNFAYEWNANGGNIIGDNNILTPLVNEDGTYILTVQNTLNFCEAEAQVIVGIDTVAPTILILEPDTLNCTETTVELNANNSSTGINFTNTWQTNNGNIVGDINTLTTQIVEPGDYELMILNTQNGCSNSNSITVFQDTIAPVSNAGNSVELNCFDSFVTLDGSGSSTGNEFLYQWETTNGFISTNPNSTNPEVTMAGDYELIVTNNINNCTDTSLVVVTQDINAPVIDIAIPDTLNCEVDNLVIDASNSSNGLNFSYLWSTNNGDINLGDNTLTPQVSDGGDYELVILNSLNGCADSVTIAVIQDTIAPIADAGMEMTLTCVDSVLNLNGNNSSTGNEFEYLWTSSIGNPILNENTLTPSINELGIYELVVTNNNNTCTSTDIVEIFQDTITPQIEINTIGGLILNCDVSSIVLDATNSSPSGNLDFEWSTTGGNFVNGNNISNPEINMAGDYELILTNTINGCFTSDMITILDDFETPNVNILFPDTLTCNTIVITLSGAGSSIGNDYTYTWSTTNGNIVSGVNDLDCEIDASGEYVLTVLNVQNNCSSFSSVTVIEDVELPQVDAGTSYEFNCIETQIMLQATASQGNEFTYEWSTTDGNILLGTTTLQPFVNETGTYILTVTNLSNGCTATSEAIVTEDLDVPTGIEYEVTPPLCHGDFNGEITITNVIGGEAPFKYAINDESFSNFENFAYLTAGSYLITILDADGCELETTIEITQPEEVDVELGDDIIIELGASATLEAITNISFNDLDTVIWESSGTIGVDCEDCLIQDVSPLLTSTYSILLMNENGCITEDNVKIYVTNERRIYIPNAFSPNDDGLNDKFMIYGGLGVESVETFQIFTRWGELVFEENNFQPSDDSKGWNGYFKGKKMNPAVFVFFAKVKYINGDSEIFRGDVFLK